MRAPKEGKKKNVVAFEVIALDVVYYHNHIINHISFTYKRLKRYNRFQIYSARSIEYASNANKSRD